MANCRYCGTDCPEQGEHDRFFDCALYTKRKPTNADRIRGMSDEELALLLSAGFSCESICSECDPMGKYLGAACDNDCAKHYLDWLRQPAISGYTYLDGGRSAPCRSNFRKT